MVWKWLTEWAIGQFQRILGSGGLTRICRNVGTLSIRLDGAMAGPNPVRPKNSEPSATNSRINYPMGRVV
jgi:hypothetical protein